MTHNWPSQAARILAIGAALVFVALMYNSKSVRARDDQNGDESEQSRIQRGFEVAPVQLNLEGKDRALVGLGSYIVNVVGDCNGCHSADTKTEFAPGGNPYFRMPPFTGTKQTNTATYLGGGRDLARSAPFPIFIPAT